MVVVMYTDQLVHIGYITEEWWDEFTYRWGNVIEIDIPEDILKSWYKEKLEEKYECSFWKWYCEESIADDMDEFFDFTDWRPFLADVKRWH